MATAFSIRGSIRRARLFVYFYEGNDLDENGYIAGRVAGEGAVTRESIARYVGERYGAPPRLRCFTDLGETMFKMGHFLITNTESFETLRKPSARNKVLAGGAAHAAPALQKPPAERDASALEASFTVFDVSLEWLRRNFSAPVTVVYLPSPAAIYRHAESSVDVYVRWPLNEVQAMPAADIYAASQRTCERIRELTLARGARFIDMRPALRAAAASAVIHGPQDWNHFNAAAIACWARRWRGRHR